MSENPTREEIVEALQIGERNIVRDAADIYATNQNTIEVRHEAADGEIIVQLTAEFAFEWNCEDEDEDGMLPDEVAERI